MRRPFFRCGIVRIPAVHDAFLRNLIIHLVFRTPVSKLLRMSSKLVWASFLGCALVSHVGSTAFAKPNTPEAKAEVVKPDDPATETGNPYEIIVDRNVFRLTTPPVVTDTTPDPALSLPTVKLTGIIKTSGEPLRALFVSIPKDPKEQTAYFNLREGERDGTLELVKILEDKEAADVINSGTPATVMLKDSKDNKPPGPGPGPGSGQPPGQPPGFPGQPPMAGGPAQPPQASSPGGVTIAGGTVLPTVDPAAQPGNPAQRSIPMPTRMLRGVPPPPMAEPSQ